MYCLYLTSIGWFSSYFLLSLSNYCNCRLLMLGMYSFSLKIQLRIFLEHKKAIPFLTTYQKVFLVIFLMICYLVSSWMSFITSLRLALLGFRSDIVHGLLFRFLVIQYLYEATVNDCRWRYCCLTNIMFPLHWLSLMLPLHFDCVYS